MKKQFPCLLCERLYAEMEEAEVCKQSHTTGCAAVVNCDYCGGEARFVSGIHVYPHLPELWKKQFWLCRPCGAYVGCHAGTNKPLGRLANDELRRAKIAAHAAFDPFWKAQGWKRNAAYRWLSEQLGIERSACHIGMFDESLCARIVALVEESSSKAEGRA